MWKFLAQVLNLHHSRDPSHCSDNAGSLTCPTTRRHQGKEKKKKNPNSFLIICVSATPIMLKHFKILVVEIFEMVFDLALDIRIMSI